MNAIENLKAKLESPFTEVYKYTERGMEQKSPEMIKEWIEDFPHLIRSYSPKSGRFLTKTSLYKIV